jgi:CheY-like chemotaxis protein
MKKILVIDDHPSIRQIVGLALRNNFSVTKACDAVSAIEQIKASRPDAIVLDVMMPGDIDGYQLCECIKRDPVLADIYIVLVTACGQVTDQEKGLALGANAYFVKPFSALELARHLTNALQTGTPCLDKENVSI